MRAWCLFDLFSQSAPRRFVAERKSRLCCSCLLPSVAEVVLFQAVTKVVSVTRKKYACWKPIDLDVSAVPSPHCLELYFPPRSLES